MIKKKILLSALILLPTSALLIAEDDMLSTMLNDNKITEIIPQATSNTLLEAESEKNDFLIEQQFMCEQEREGEGVVCQMYECINNDCKVTTPIKVTSGDQKPITTVTITEEKPETTSSTESDMLYTDTEQFIPTDLNEFRPLTPQEEQTTLPSENEEVNTSVTTDVGVSDDEEIRELEYEIKSAERMCERAETDPRQQAICEAASAKVQWKKEKIRALEDATRRRYYRNK